MEVKIRSIEMTHTHLNESYVILDDCLRIKEFAENNHFFNSLKGPFIGKRIVDVLNEDYKEIFTQISPHLQESTPSIFEVSIENKLVMEVKVFPVSNQTIVFLKDKTKFNHVEQLLKENSKRTSFLSEVSNDIITSKEPKQLMTTLFDKISTFLDLDLYFNYILDEKKGKIKLTNFYGISDEIAKEIEWLEIGEAVCGTVAKNQTKIVAGKVRESSDPILQLIKNLGVRAYVCHPLFSNGSLLGTLSFGTKKRDTFTTDELEIIEQLCKQVAIFLERWYLNSKLTQKNEALKYSNHELILAKEKSDQGNKAKAEFLLLMSHEFRTPLNSLNGYLQILLSDLQDPLTKNQKNRLKKMRKASKQLKTMINDILDFVRYDIGKLKMKYEYFNINTVINDCINATLPSANKKEIVISYQKLQRNFTIYSDKKRIEQVMLNLISNAVKYNIVRGEILISCTLEVGSLLISVEDSGIGITGEELNHIFSPFYRSSSISPTIEGTGIGLALVRKIADELGGNVNVKSIPGMGSNFTVKIPVKYKELK